MIYGDYSSATDPTHPIVVHCVHVPYVPTAPDPRSALRMARKTLFAKKFEDFEKEIKKDLHAILGSEFNPEDDILAITVNRWTHGYAYFPNSLGEEEEVSTKMCDLARQPVGRIHIAAADAGWSAYAHSAIDQGKRAVDECV